MTFRTFTRWVVSAAILASIPFLGTGPALALVPGPLAARPDTVAAVENHRERGACVTGRPGQDAP